MQEARCSLLPEKINKAGFCKGNMTIDHILTLCTIVEKYGVLHQPVYGAFIDFRKAFDSVWRDALMLKLARMGINTTLRKTIKEYYSNRNARLKVGEHLTDEFGVDTGVIQGEPPSPELFKIFIQDLSDNLDRDAINSPSLNGIPTSHLLWADDLYVNSLTAEGLQILLDTLYEYCLDWGLTPNPIKCKVMVFNKRYIKDKGTDDELEFRLGVDSINQTTSYTYLGVEITENLNYKTAAIALARKGRRAMGSLMSTIDREIIKPALALKIFKSLVQPILLYACQIWAPLIATKQILGLKQEELDSFFDNTSRIPCEAVHLRFMKWILGIHKRTTNVFCWSELGEFPLFIPAIKQAVRYQERLSKLSDNRMVFHAYQEQQRMELKWYDTLRQLKHRTLKENKSTEQILQSRHIYLSNIYKICHSKLEYLAAMDNKFGLQYYLQVLDNFQTRRTLAKLRSSSHCLEVETGRYTNPITPKELRFCKFCKNIGISVIETEYHFIMECPAYAYIRERTRGHITTGRTIVEVLSMSRNYDELNNVSKIISTMYERRSKTKCQLNLFEMMAIDSVS